MKLGSTDAVDLTNSQMMLDGTVKLALGQALILDAAYDRRTLLVKVGCLEFTAKVVEFADQDGFQI